MKTNSSESVYKFINMGTCTITLSQQRIKPGTTQKEHVMNKATINLQDQKRLWPMWISGIHTQGSYKVKAEVKRVRNTDLV